MCSYSEILKLMNKLETAQRAYLLRLGWRETCNTPGSYWMWCRDFSDVDARRQAYHPATASPFQPYGFVMANTETAVSMSRNELNHLISEDAEEDEE